MDTFEELWHHCMTMEDRDTVLRLNGLTAFEIDHHRAKERIYQTRLKAHQEKYNCICISNLHHNTVAQLKQICKERQVKCSKLKKNDIINLLIMSCYSSHPPFE